eukprot:GDKK01020531.1.p1 GENE.GDKK01020531.1~~GDKK01020531.1.p1  ORF type:complete len:135 (-),score=15.74 GDKK01020531.1:59-463(-)
MKIKKLIPLLLILISASSFGQDGSFMKKKREQIKSLKVAFITTELQLTPEESTKFWPLYNSYEDKQREIKKEKVKSYMDRMDDGSFDKLSEKEAATILSQIENSEDELHEARKKIHSQPQRHTFSCKDLEIEES